MPVHMYRLMLSRSGFGCLDAYKNEFCIFYIKYFKYRTERKYWIISEKKNVCYSTGFTSVLSPAKFMLLLRGNDCLYLCVHCLYHPVCIGKLATIPCNPSVVLSQGTVHLELQDEGLYRVTKYYTRQRWINLITEALHKLCRNMQNSEFSDIKLY